ncbi:SusC/RagA family TonB-linked outer membrane protein [Phocaeicola coprophilus]|uniref:SusC/RagA family TonB-linked outer membrane protein n=1 Tax=Phocaeicola coprophilus TaxID=387090 RepID=UPI00242BACDA|nr:TonB-dependent receptor [Phocaeicola coprophilus]
MKNNIQCYRSWTNRMVLGASLTLVAAGTMGATESNAETLPSAIVAGVTQQRTVKGTVVDSEGLPVIGANILVKGTTNGVITDFEGNFLLQVSGDCTLEISFVGYKTQEIKVTSSTRHLSVKLEEDTELLDEVVVVGYGTQKKVNLTGSVSSVDFEEQAKSRPVTNVSNALAGMSAGVQVMQNSGQPGSDGSTIRIRGIGTLNNNDPLVLIDGVEGSMDLVNPQDIENISVLKDAASASIYGSRAANGVILITTKKGKSGKISVSYSGRISYAQPTNLIDQVTNYADYMEWINESFENIGQPAHFAQSTIDLWREKSKDPNGLNENGVPNYIAYPNTDWQEYLFGNGVVNDHNVSVSGGSDRLRMQMSAGYLDNPGLVENTGIKRYTLRANVEADITKWLTVGTHTFASQEDKEAGNFDNANNYLRQTTPGLYPEWNGAYGYPEAPEESATANSIGAFLNSQDGERHKTNFNTTLFTRITPLKGLSWDFNLNYKRYWEDNSTWTNPYEKVRFSDGTVMSPATAPADMTTYFYNRSDYSYTIQNILRYNTVIAENHDLSVMAGYEEYYYKYEYRSAQKKGLIDSSVHTPSSATEMQSIAGSATDRAHRSFFGRVNYAYKSRYLLEGNLRYDGNSRFHKDYRWGTFPSFSAGWRISEEPFMTATRKWLDNLKLRVSYGSVGNDGGSSTDYVGDYDYQSVYSSSRYPLGGVLTSGLASTSLANTILSWETSTMANVGVDFNALRNRLSFTMDAFYGKTTGILYTPSIYLTVGSKSAPTRNLAEMTKKGVEFTLGWQDHVGDFSYSVSGNFSYTPNKVTKYKGEFQAGYDEDGNYTSNIGDVASSSSSVNPIVEGHIANEYYLKNPYQGTGRGYEVDGINGGPVDGMIRTETDMAWLQAMIEEGYTFMPNKTVAKDKIWYGDYIYADYNGDGIYGGTDDREFQGVSSSPKYNFGLQMSAAWKGFDVSMNWAGQAGFKLYWGSSTGYNSPTTRVGVALGTDIAYNHYFYDPENPTDLRTNINAKYGRLVNGESGWQNTETSSLYLFNANYLKLKNLTFGYTFPKNMIKKVYMENLRLYVSIENVFNITNFPGQDPELGASPEYTSVRQFAFGVNLSF